MSHPRKKPTLLLAVVASVGASIVISHPSPFYLCYLSVCRDYAGLCKERRQASCAKLFFLLHCCGEHHLCAKSVRFFRLKLSRQNGTFPWLVQSLVRVLSRVFLNARAIRKPIVLAVSVITASGDANASYGSATCVQLKICYSACDSVVYRQPVGCLLFCLYSLSLRRRWCVRFCAFEWTNRARCASAACSDWSIVFFEAHSTLTCATYFASLPTSV